MFGGHKAAIFTQVGQFYFGRWVSFSSAVTARLIIRHACCHHYPGGCGTGSLRSLAYRQRPSSLLWRVGIHIGDFEACSVFTYVAARMTC
jgi:hypothetical protein